jgi:hypothetical protein
MREMSTCEVSLLADKVASILERRTAYLGSLLIVATASAQHQNEQWVNPVASPDSYGADLHCASIG